MFDNLSNLPQERRWRQQSRPVAGVLALIGRVTADDPAGGAKYLLIRRSQEPYAGHWALVGGKIEFGETLAAAVEREVKEETGLDSQFVAVRGVVNERLAPAGGNAQGGHFILFVCELQAGPGRAREHDEGEVAWFTPAEIDQFYQQKQIIPSDYAMLRHFAYNHSSFSFVEAEMTFSAVTTHDNLLIRFDEIR